MTAPSMVLNDHRDELHTLAKALLEYETLTGDEIKTVLAGGTIDRGPIVQAVAAGSGLVDPEGQAAQAGGIGGPAPAGA